MNWSVIDDVIKNALLEDIPVEDITTVNTINKDSISTVDLISKEDGIIAGLEVFGHVFVLLGNVCSEFYVNDGTQVVKGQLIGRIKGNTRNILSGERTALNFLQRMSGIATLTRRYVQELEGTGARLLDTRKTTPNLRLLEKYAVKVGGGYNHRYSLSDGIMLKDNHISAAGGIKNAVDSVRDNSSFVRKIEVETETIEQVYEALEAKADIIMLDNMNIETMKKAVKIINKKALTEASGNITLENIKKVAATGVDYISVGAITHSYKILDLSIKNLLNI
ncbi:putative nicotinate-nucleotide pyrophosphorylase [Oxobacter pfennigii]|uniref:Probable nicotinate-nucleotide pyrophosphorylase [carboxylating] n=1 Tax=Oxobacter pfennigii TaxID=36849 RepID=A0A0P8YGU8_9CLOT|nr:carboxylating nicotinate-nucleotide diphosphorylase [Oxobacter pfennigii]KPU46297.1 putative nicotinate-nucleotide pyrophosphorylase [Oxobacter pfennigii]